MKIMRIMAVALPLSILAAGGCSTPPAGQALPAAAAATHNAESIATSLRAAGFAVRVADTIAQPFFSVAARVLVVDDLDLQVYEYPSVAAASADAANISPSGSPIGTFMPNWMRPPHIYRKDQLILIYLGDNARVRSVLEAQAGAQIAGAR